MPKIDGLGVALSFVKGLPPKHVAQLARRIFALADNPLPTDSHKLAGFAGLHRIDVGEYRIVYRILASEDVVDICVIGKRNDDEVYKELKRRFK